MKILYVASTASHLRRFHLPYIEALKTENEVFLMANGDGVNFDIPFSKKMLSLHNLTCLFKVRKILKRERFQQVILNTSLAAFLVRLAMFGMRKRPYVLNIVHGYLFHEVPKGKKDSFLLACERFLAKYTDEIAVMNAEDLRIANAYHLSKNEPQFIRGMGYRVPNLPCEKNHALKKELGVAEDEILLGFVGELSQRKNQSFLLQVLKSLQETGKRAKLLLVGEGAQRDALTEEANRLGLQNDVIFAGNQEPVFPWLAAMDIYLSASKIEGLPFNMMEAMAFGLPIAATDVKGQNDLLEKENLYPEEDLQACVQLVNRLAEQPTGIACRSYPNLLNFSLENVFEEDLKLMKRMKP